MKLPNAEQVVVEREKIADYLLADSHPDNGGKAKFFARFGFRHDEWQILAMALCKLAQEAEVSASSTSAHGQKFVIVGPIETPSGRPATVQTIWIMDTGAAAARLVTAYPARE
jgi:hypothetical protein